jgi:hypothetical protein
MKRILYGQIVAVLAITHALAGGLPDPLVAPDINQSDPVCNTSWQCNAPYVDTNGRLPCPIVPDTQIKVVEMQAGQSNGETSGETAVVMTHASAVCNLNYLDGQVYQHATPALGTSRSSILANGLAPQGYMGDLIADTIVANGSAAQVITVPMNIGGSRVDQWADGGPLRDIPCIAMQRLKLLGITPQTPNTYFIFRWTQGESDRQGPIQVGTTTADYMARLGQVFARLDACGFVGRKFVDIVSWSGTNTWPPVATAQANMANGTTIFIGANLDSIPNSCRIDMTHLNSACGIPQGAAMFMNSLHASGYPF